MNVRILLVDDHRILRDGLRVLLQGEGGFTVAGEAGDVATALKLVKECAPDLVIMDVHLPDGTGIQACEKIVSESPKLRVLMLSGNSDPEQLTGALRAGARGYLLKEQAADELTRAIKAIMAGQVYLCPAAATALVDQITTPAKAAAEPAKPVLSERELQVLRFIAEGLRNKEIAEKLSVSTKSVETYRARLMTKLNCAGTAELVRYAIRERIAAV